MHRMLDSEAKAMSTGIHVAMWNWHGPNRFVTYEDSKGMWQGCGGPGRFSLGFMVQCLDETVAGIAAERATSVINHCHCQRSVTDHVVASNAAGRYGLFLVVACS